MSSFEIYLLFIAIPKFGMLLTGVSAGMTILCLWIIGESKENDPCNGAIITGIIFFILLLLSFFVPTQKEMATIYLAPKIINNQTIQQIPAEIMKFIDKEIESKD